VDGRESSCGACGTAAAATTPAGFRCKRAVFKAGVL